MLIALLLTQAAVSPEQADARCVVALSKLTDLAPGDAQAQRASLTGSMYFLGKILGRNPSADLTRLLADATGAVAPAPKTPLTACAAEIERAGNAVIAAGTAIDNGQAPARK